MVYIIVNIVMYMFEEKILILLLYIYKISDVYNFLINVKWIVLNVNLLKF